MASGVKELADASGIDEKMVIIGANFFLMMRSASHFATHSKHRVWWGVACGRSTGVS
jgi:hypothetical protein